MSELSGIVKVILSFFRHGEESTFELHHSQILVSCKNHIMSTDMKKYLTNFLGINKQARNYGIGCYEMKLYHLVKSSSGKTENLNPKSMGNGASKL